MDKFCVPYFSVLQAIVGPSGLRYRGPIASATVRDPSNLLIEQLAIGRTPVSGTAQNDIIIEPVIVCLCITETGQLLEGSHRDGGVFGCLTTEAKTRYVRYF